MTTDANLLGTLIDDAEVDWLVDALHAVVSICHHYPGSLADKITEALLYELAPIKELAVKPGNS